MESHNNENIELLNAFEVSIEKIYKICRVDVIFTERPNLNSLFVCLFFVRFSCLLIKRLLELVKEALLLTSKIVKN
jgi:hypothetical protein